MSDRPPIVTEVMEDLDAAFTGAPHDDYITRDELREYMELALTAYHEKLMDQLGG
ncbi:hypothetical protein [Nitratireductor sp. GCM10026969]|uniref:hypothetical protein n=1 Tax=Nitratireductor sp. GCM10026969 TaxID=3252645 RepID=UPI003613253D